MSWFDLVKNSATDLGKEAIRNAGQQIKFGGNPQADHIPAQQETGAKFAQTLNDFNAGKISAADARAQINLWDSAFLLLTQQIGSARALKGGAELHALAGQIINSLGGPTGGGVIIPPTGVPGGSIVPAMSTTTLLLIAGVGAVLLLSRKGRT